MELYYIIAAAGLLSDLVEIFLPLVFRLEFLYLLLDLSSCLPPKTRHDNVFVVLAELLVIRVERLQTRHQCTAGGRCPDTRRRSGSCPGRPSLLGFFPFIS